MDEHQMFQWTELNPLCLLHRVLRELPVILAAGLAAVLLALSAVQLLYTPKYTASATMAVSVKSGSYSSVLNSLSLSAEIADTFTELFESTGKSTG